MFKLSSVKYEILGFVVFFISLISTGAVLHYTGYTFQVVDEIYCRELLPWNLYVEKVSCTAHYHSGDDLFENDFISNELMYLSNNPHQQSYSERIMNGYPIRDAFAANQYTLFHTFNKFFPPYSSINFSALLILFISFTLGYFIARLLEFKYYYAIILGVLSITLSYVSLFESWNWVLLGHGLIVAGLILFYKYKRVYLFGIFVLGGALLILLSSIYQFYLYTLISFIFWGLFCFFCCHKKRFIAMWLLSLVLFGIAAMFANFSLLSHYEFLSSSQKINPEITFDNKFIKKKGFASDPVSWIWGGITTHSKAVANIFGEGSSINKMYSYSQRGGYEQGAAFLFLMVIGLWILYERSKGYVLYIIFWILYSMGPVQIALALTLGGPFWTETSIRASLLALILGSFAAVYALREFLEQQIRLTRILQVILLLSLCYILFLSGTLFVWDIFAHNRILPGVFYTFVSTVFLLLAVKILRKKDRVGPAQKNIFRACFLVVLTFPIFSNLFLGSPPAALSLHRSSFYFPQTSFLRELEKNEEIVRVASMQTPESETIYTNGPVRLGLSSITGYRNPMYKEYFDLYAYHRFLIESSKDAGELLKEYRKSAGYTSNQLRPFEAPDNNIVLSEITKRYFALHGVNGIIGSEDLLIDNPEWERAAVRDKLSLWKSKEKITPFFFASEIIVIPDDISRMKHILENPDFDIQKQVVLSEGRGIKYVVSTSTASHFEIIEQRDGYRLIEADVNARGVLTFPVTYNKNWEAKIFKDGLEKKLKTVKANHTFLGLELTPGKGRIEIVYNDKPRPLNRAIALGGGAMLGIFALLARSIGGGNLVPKRVFPKV